MSPVRADMPGALAAGSASRRGPVPPVGVRGTEAAQAAPCLQPRVELSFWQHMVAGALAGTVEHVAMFPMDTVKTRMQALPHGGASIGHDLNYSTVRSALTTVLRLEGVRGLYRGVDAMALGAGPAHALYFATYEAVKRLLGTADEAGSHPGVTALAGATATVVNDAVLTPLDTVKQRLQIANSPYRGMLDCARRMFHEEGAGSFFRSCAFEAGCPEHHSVPPISDPHRISPAADRTTLVMNVPFTAVQFVVYESGKKALVASHLIGSTDEEGLIEQLVAGGGAGGGGAAITNPLVISKTRLQTQGMWEPVDAAHGGGQQAARRPVSGPPPVLRMLRDIVSKEGPGALARGMGPRVLFHVPAAAICWGTYETGKEALTRISSASHRD
jgi:solute carrier family 25 iron transporter 28/37